MKILETDSASITAADYFTFTSYPVENHLDDIVVLALNGDTVESETFAYNAANELTSQDVNGDTITFAYDQFGRMTSKSDGTYTGTYYYHYGDKLTKVASNFLGEGTVTYTLGGDQKRRSGAVSGGDTIKYRYDQGWSVLNEETGGGTLQATYVHSPIRQIGTVLATSAGSTASSGTWNYYFQDAIGSTRGLWDQDALRLGKYEYTPYGGKYSDHGEDITRKFTGHDWDADARLYYTAYRYYSPDANRWLTRDPLGMHDGPNVYAYVVNNPVSLWDADGRFFGVISVGARMLGGLATRFAAASWYMRVLYISLGIIAIDIGVQGFLAYSDWLSGAGDGVCDLFLLGFLIAYSMWQPVALTADIMFAFEAISTYPSRLLMAGLGLGLAYQTWHGLDVFRKTGGEIRDCRDLLVGLVDSITLGALTGSATCTAW